MRKSWVFMGTTSIVIGVTMIVAWFLAIIAAPLLVIGGLGAILLGLVLPNNKGFYFTYDSNSKKLVKKRV